MDSINLPNSWFVIRDSWFVKTPRPKFQNPNGKARRAGGFTLVELLTVIGIIAVLAGMIAVAVNVVYNNSSARRTRVAMENAMNLQREYENATPLTGAIKTYSVDSTWSATTSPYTIFEATLVAMDKFLKIPANQSAMDKISATNVTSLSVTLAATSTLNPTATPVTLTKPLLLDGWQMPLLYVGSNGLTKLKSSASGSLVLRPDLASPDRRPFWVSAGPDGDFSTHDDNVYSFEN